MAMLSTPSGYSVAVDVDTVVVGAYGDDDNGSASGSAYVFTRDSNGEWSQKKKLTDEDGEAGDWFGYSVAVDTAAHTALVGAGSAHVLDIHDWESVPGIAGQLPTEHTVENLFNGRVYDFQVRAVNLRSPGPQAEGEAIPQANGPPVAVDDASTNDEDRAIVIRVLDNDSDMDGGDSLSVIEVSTPSNGSVAITGAGTTVTYTPKPELPISSCLGPSKVPSSTRAIVVSLTDAVNHPIKLTEPFSRRGELAFDGQRRWLSPRLHSLQTPPGTHLALGCLCSPLMTSRIIATLVLDGARRYAPTLAGISPGTLPPQQAETPTSWHAAPDVHPS